MIVYCKICGKKIGDRYKVCYKCHEDSKDKNFDEYLLNLIRIENRDLLRVSK
mgnify:CR=1 FL=1